jgi:Tfp pilus assembly protein PilX
VLRIREDERGVAMVVAIMVLFVVLLLSAVVYAESVHNSGQSANNRKRLQSVDAAEAGLDYFFNCVGHTAPASLSACAVSQTVAVAPGTSSFTITPTWYRDANGTTQADPATFTDTNLPRSVKVVSTGTTNGKITRRMQSFIALPNPLFGSVVGAVLVDTSVNFKNSFTLTGDNIANGDIYVTCESTQASCDASITSGNQVINGSIFVPKGSLLISAQAHISGSVWANDSVTIDHSQAVVDQNATSSTSSLTVSRGNVTGTGSYCTGSAPSPSNVHGGTIQLCQAAPPAVPFPHDAYNLSDWQTGCGRSPLADCYAEVPFTDCAAADAYIEGTGANTFAGGAGVPAGFSGVIVRILSTCTFTTTNNANINLGADLAIVSNGPISLSQQSTWTGVGANREMHLFVPWGTSCPTGDISVGNNTNFNSLISLSIYTPCTAHMSNQQAFHGQVIGGSVDIANNWTMAYQAVKLPGTTVSGFNEDIAYIREIS